MIELECQYCLHKFNRRLSEHNNNIKRKRKITVCSHKCLSNLRRKYTDKKRICKQCNNEFLFNYHNQLFCSSSCSSTYNNSKRKKKKLCIICKNVVEKYAKYCNSCRFTRSFEKNNKADYSQISLEDLKAKYSLSAYHAKLRGHARSQYAKSKKPMKCKNCDYDLHVDICHVRDIKDFPLDTKVSVVNHIDNLIALDKRCHWEYDHGLLIL